MLNSVLNKKKNGVLLFLFFKPLEIKQFNLKEILTILEFSYHYLELNYEPRRDTIVQF